MAGPTLPISPPYRLKRIRGVRRVEYEEYEGWIARNQLGVEILEPGFRWNTRSGAWHAAFESDIFGPFPEETAA
jgi:hypothetical protein